MKNNDYLSKVGFGIGLLCVLSSVLWLMSSPVQAAPSVLPPRPTAEPSPQPETRSEPACGATIQLSVSPASEALWTVVQWQDAWGNWHDVEGWRGTLDELSRGTGTKIWWVARPDYAKGPFRWAVYAHQGGQLLGTSGNFSLPSRDGTMVVAELALGNTK